MSRWKYTRHPQTYSMMGFQFLVTLVLLIAFYAMSDYYYSQTKIVARTLFYLPPSSYGISLLLEIASVLLRFPMILFLSSLFTAKYASQNAIILTRQKDMRSFFRANILELFTASFAASFSILLAIAVFLLPSFFSGFTADDLQWLLQLSPLVILFPLGNFIFLLYSNLITLFFDRRYSFFLAIGVFLLNSLLLKIPLPFAQVLLQISPLAAQLFFLYGIPPFVSTTNLDLLEYPISGNFYFLIIALTVQFVLLYFCLFQTTKKRDYL